MKSIFFAAMGCILLAGFFSCSKKNDSPMGGGSSSIKIEVGPSSSPWEATRGVVIGTSFVEGKHNLTISGIDENFNGEASGFSLVLSQAAEIGVGNYTIGSAADGGASITKVNGKTYMAGPGASGVALALQITEVSGSGNTKKFKGAFQGQMQGAAPADRLGMTGTFSSF